MVRSSSAIPGIGVFALLFAYEMGYFVFTMKRPHLCRKCAAARIAALVIWMAGVLWLSLAPHLPHIPSDLFLFSWDKSKHAVAYALMTILSGRAFVLFSRTPRRGWIWGGVFAIAYGGLMEAAQGLLTEVRQAEFGDMLANACGIVITLTGVFACFLVLKRRKP